MRASTCFSAIALAQVCGRALAADENAPNRKPVNVLAGAAVGRRHVAAPSLQRLVDTLPAISRGIIVLHGRLRDADGYDMSAHTAPSAAALTKER